MEAFDADLQAELAGDLELIRTLGQGATASVYLAREPALQRLVALKVLGQDLAADEVGRKRFEREAQSAARISHPHVTQVYRVGRLASDLPYMVMEYVDGRTLTDVIKARGPLEVDRAKEVLSAVAAALAAAHARGIVHRDVRPGNVFLEKRTERAVLGDFGIAALVETGAAASPRLTAAGVRLGNVRYMSPEQVLGDPVTEQSDLYAFGILAYETLTGQGPYEARSDAQLVAAHLEAEPRPLRSLRPEVDAGLASLIERCLARDPNERPRADEVADALQSPASAMAAVGVVGPGADDSPVAAFLAELRRRRVYQVLVAYGALAVAVLGGAQAVYDAFAFSNRSYRLLVSGVLAGFPIALVLSWAYDVTATGIRRTQPGTNAGGGRIGALKWAGLGSSVVVVLMLGWFLLRGA